MTRRLLGAAALGGALLAGPLLGPGAAFAAAGDPAAGWWSRTKLGGAAPAEAPDAVPDGGLQVAGDLTGPVSVSALRVAAVDGARVSGLRLQVARATGTPRVLVCPVAARWQPVDGDRLDAAPPADCGAASVEAQVTDGVLVVDLVPGFGDAALDVRLQPVPGTLFSLDLAPVTAASVRTTPLAGPAAPPAGPPAAPPPAPEPAPPLSVGSAPEPDPLPMPPAPEPAVALPPPLLGAGAPALPPPAGPVLAPDLPPDLPPAAAPTDPLAAAFPRPPEALDTRQEQVAALALLAGLVALAVVLQRTPARAPVRLGGAARLTRDGEVPASTGAPAHAPERGVGRFRGPRSRPPVAL